MDNIVALYGHLEAGYTPRKVSISRWALMEIVRVIAVLCSFLSSLAYGASSAPPPSWPVPDIKTSSISTQPVTGVTLGSFEVVFERTTFKDVVGALGEAPIQQQGDAGEFQMWVCYTLVASHARVWLTSSELGGQKYIDGMVALRISSDVKSSPECPDLGSQHALAAIDRGIWLGTPLQKVKAILGRPNKSPKAVIYYSYAGKDGTFDVNSTLALRMRNNIVTELHAMHSATN